MTMGMLPLTQGTLKRPPHRQAPLQPLEGAQYNRNLLEQADEAVNNGEDTGPFVLGSAGSSEHILE